MSSKQTTKTNSIQSCPCGSKQEFKNCCQPFINKTAIPQTPEQLMRSRYSAYAVKDAEYILATYALSKQVDNALNEIKEWAQQTKWLALKILTPSSKKLEKNGQYDHVEFIADYLVADEVWQMHERSRFIQEEGQWSYLDGDIISHECIKTVTRNSPCPCGSARKYKRCCL
ncbi:YchJ family protein [Thalassomonas sp. M1454]|uniref:YchJ family protein n=1 Tax=Thalassomonas sp. M1454 TaxID=2594477 RepID=UPI00163D45F2|nr:YchJ family protein [Thalassomonas sp. M1454]